MRRLICNLLSVVHSILRLCLLKLFCFKGLKFSLIQRISPNVVVEINRGANLKLGKKVRMHSGCKLKVRNNASVQIGDGTKFNYNCIVVSKEQIKIGAGVEFGPGVCIYDHDHDYRSGLKKSGFLTAPISIGDNCWIGANSIILRGAIIGNNCVIAAGSIVKGNVPDNSLFFQKREDSIKYIQ